MADRRPPTPPMGMLFEVCPTCGRRMAAPIMKFHAPTCTPLDDDNDAVKTARAVRGAVKQIHGSAAEAVQKTAVANEAAGGMFLRQKLETDEYEKLRRERYHDGGGKEKQHEYYMEKKHDLAHHWKCSLVEEPPRAAVAIGIIRSLAFSSGTAPLLFLTEKYVERAGPETGIAVQLLECRTSADVLDRHEEALWWVRAYSTELEDGGYSPTPSDRTYAGRIVAAVCGADRPLRKQAAAMLVGCATGTSDRVVAVTASVGAVAAVKMLERAGFVGKDERRAARTAKKERRATRAAIERNSDGRSSSEEEDDG